MSHRHHSHDPEDHHFHPNHYHELPPPPPPPPPCCNSNSSCYCSCSSAYYYYPPPPPPPQPIPIPIPTTTTSTSDQLLHAIAAHLLLQSTSSPPTPTAPQSPQPPPPPPPIDTSTTTANLYSYYLKRQPLPNPQPKHDQQHLLYYSLLRRISALEHSISHLHAPPPKPHFPPPPPRHRHGAADQQKIKSFSAPSKPPPQRPSVRELAARTIQTHFRHFLVRRSRTLRQLKHLAIIKSRAASLKTSVAEHSARRRRGDPAAVSEAAMELLFQLDAIQGEDPMIREGKRAISRELTRILEFVDKVLVKEHERMEEEMEEMEIGEDDGNGTRNGGIMGNPALLAKRRVRFVGDEEEVNGLHQLSAEDVDVDEDEDEGGEEEEKRFESLEEAEKRKKGGRRVYANAKPGLSAPLQVHMESRRMPGQTR